MTSFQPVPKKHFDVNARELAEFLMSKERLRERMDGAAVCNNELRTQIAEGLRDFEIQLDRLRKQVEPSVVIPATHLRSPVAPHSTPIG